MSTWSFVVPSLPAPASPVGPTGSSIATTVFRAGAAFDLAIDPMTLDFIDADDGTWVETTDSRTMVIMQIESTLNAWWGDATAGSRLHAILSNATEQDVKSIVDELKRCLQPLVNDSVIETLNVSSDVDEAGRPVLLMTYTDRSTGRLLDLKYVPLD